MELDASALEKYRLYDRTVQDPPTVLEFFNQVYREIRGRGRRALTLREDFCGTGAVACAWVRQSSRHRAVGVDLSPEPLAYARSVHAASLSPAPRTRVRFLQTDVRRARGRFDLIAALNFSFAVFHTRKELLSYFRSVRKSLRPGGLFVLDIFGGSDGQNPHIQRRRYGKLRYTWQCSRFDAITHRAQYAIHFRIGAQKSLRNAFTYDWRIWTFPELREALEDAGFRMSRAYWEGDDHRGGGNGIYSSSESEENCLSWLGYLVAQS